MMINSAMKLTKTNESFKDGEAEQLLAGFNDSEKVSSWAMDAIASCIKVGVVSGKDEKLVAPKDNITRGEVASIIQRLLKKSDLI